MKKMCNQALILVIIILLIAAPCVAQNGGSEEYYGESDAEEGEYYGSEFFNGDFDYENADYNALTPEQWEQLVYGRILQADPEGIYNMDAFYDNMQSDAWGYPDLDFNKINWDKANQESLANSPVGMDNYCDHVMGTDCGGMSVGEGFTGSVKFDGSGISLTNNQQNIPDLSIYEEGTKFEVRGNKIHIIPPVPADLSKMTSVPPITEGRAVIDIPPKADGILSLQHIDGTSTVLDGSTELIAKDGEFIIPEGQTVTIDDEITVKTTEKTIIYGVGEGPYSSHFRSMEKNGNIEGIYNGLNKDFNRQRQSAIYLGDENIAIRRDCPKCRGADYLETPFEVTFHKGNPYTDITTQGSGFPVQENYDRLSISAVDGGFIMSKEGTTAIGYSRMKNGNRELNFADGELFAKSDMRSDPARYNSVAMSIEIQDKGRRSEQDSGVIINNGNGIEFGRNLAYASVNIDPGKYSDSGGVYIDTNNLAQAKNLNMVVTAYKKDTDDPNIAYYAAEDYMNLLGRGQYPIMFDCSNPGTEAEIEACKNLIESFDNKDELDGKVVGHSGIYEKCNKGLDGREKCNTVAGILVGKDKNGKEIYAELDRKELSLGCSVAEQDIEAARVALTSYLDSGRDMEEFKGDPLYEAIHDAYEKALEKRVETNTEQYVLKPALEELGYGKIYGDEEGKLELSDGKVEGGIPPSYLSAFVVISEYAEKKLYAYTTNEILQKLSKNEGNGYNFPSCRSAEQAKMMAELIGKDYTYKC